jgi:hypothetical protein
MEDKAETLGWQVATFAADRLTPDEKSGAGSSAVWEAYVQWCRDKNAVPLAFAVFHTEFSKVAESVGIVRRQVGAHVNYEGLRIENGVAA